MDSFCLYLWRSKNAPGTLYMANGFDAAELLCRGLTADGYIVKVIHNATNLELELCDGKLCPPNPRPAFSGPRLSPATAESGLRAAARQPGLKTISR